MINNIIYRPPLPALPRQFQGERNENQGDHTTKYTQNPFDKADQ